MSGAEWKINWNLVLRRISFITLTKPTFDRLTIEASKNLGVKAPVRKDSVIDRLDIKVDGETIQSVDLVAVNNVQRKGIVIAT